MIASGASGPLLTRTVRYLAAEVKHRLLGAREEVRIGATLAFAGEKIRENIESGQQIRQDSFFREQPGERTAAEEVFEGVLLAAQREPQEKKLRFYGNLVANIAFHPEISREQANLLIRLGQDLSYQQLCALAVFVGKVSLGLSLRQGDYRLSGHSDWESITLVQEVYDLYSRGLLASGMGSPYASVRDVNPDMMVADNLGFLLYTMMELEDVDRKDLERVAALLA